MPSKKLLIPVLLGLLALPATASAQSFAPLSGSAGCIVGEAAFEEDAAARCTKVKALTDVIKIAVAPDDKHVYAASDTAVVTFSRAADTGALTFASCLTDSGDDGRPGSEGACTDGDALNGVRDLAVSPDGKFVYAVSAYSNALVWLTRDADSGALKPAGCLKAAPRGDRCGGALNLLAPSGLAVSPDGKSVYVASGLDASIAVFKRDADTGALTPGGCVSDSGSDGRCVNGTALRSGDVGLSPDGGSAYAIAGGIALTSYTRDRDTGELAPRACVLGTTLAGSGCAVAPPLAGARDLIVAPDGQVIVADNANSAISVLKGDDLSPVACYVHQEPAGDDREDTSISEEEEEEEADPDEEAEEEEEEEEEEEPANPAVANCQPVKAIQNVLALALSSDGKTLFAGSGYGYVAAFTRDPATGNLTEFGCLESDPWYKSCATFDPSSYGSLATTSDGRSLYSTIDGGLAVLSAAVAVTNRTAKLSRSGRIGVKLACPAQRARSCRGSVGATRYRVARGASATVQVRLPRRVRASVARRGRLPVRVSARDADRTVRAARRTVVVSAR